MSFYLMKNISCDATKRAARPKANASTALDSDPGLVNSREFYGNYEFSKSNKSVREPSLHAHTHTHTRVRTLRVLLGHTNRVPYVFYHCRRRRMSECVAQEEEGRRANYFSEAQQVVERHRCRRHRHRRFAADLIRNAVTRRYR